VISREEFKDISIPLIGMLSSRGTASDLMRTLIRQEVQWTTDAGTLFRSNSISSALIGAYSRIYGTEFLTQTLKSLIEKVRSRPYAFEVDPTKSDEIVENMKNLIDMSNEFLTAIMDNISNCPAYVCTTKYTDTLNRAIRNVCYLVHTETKAKFPQNRLILVGGFYFLRYFCPAIVSPDTIHIVQGSLDAQTRRSLILVSKVLQNIANATLFNEEYMKPINPFVQEKVQIVHNFFETLVRGCSLLHLIILE
jgi:neurofibromin 1